MKRLRTMIVAAAVIAALLAAPTAAFAGLGVVAIQSPLASGATVPPLETTEVPERDASWLQILLGPLLILFSV